MSEEPFKIDLSRCRTHWDRKTKIKRGLWQCLVKPLYMLIPGRLSSLRVAVLRTMGARIGPNCNIQNCVDILIPWNLEMGRYATLAKRTRILNFATVKIGDMSIVSQDAHLCTGTHDYNDPHFKLLFKPITIESESWIASGAFVGPGVVIGRGCVIGANAVVTRSMPQWKVCAGNPCKVIKDRLVEPVRNPD